MTLVASPLAGSTAGFGSVSTVAPDVSRPASTTIPDSSPPTGGNGRLPAADVVRVATVGAVIAVHTTSVLLGSASLTGEGVLTVLHSSREVFLCLSAFVLTYSALRRPEPTGSFWRRRFPLVLGPYLVWSAVYLVANGAGWAPGTSLAVTKRLAVDLLSAGASYHLYFLLLTLQLYVVFPWFVRLLRQHERWHGPVLAGSVLLQLAFTAAIAYGLVLPGIFGAWLAHPGSWLPSYQLYVVVGVLAGLHLERCTDWVRHHGRVVAAAAITAVALGAGTFVVNLLVLGMAPVEAGAVFQPAVVLESLVAVVALYALGVRVAERCADRRRRQLAAGSDVSFGVYLAHPLLLQGIVAFGTAAGLRAWWQALPGPVAEAIVLAAVVPALYLVTARLTSLVRHLPLSVALTGRPALSPVLAPVRFRSAGPARKELL